MSRPKSRAVKPVSPSRRSGGSWKWGVALVAVVGLGALVFNATRSKPVAAGETPAAAAFLPTVANKTPPPGPAPEGMVWIPGGEFSMGSTVESESLCGLPGVTRDALPIHRVYVDGFWMDKTEVTNEQFEKFVKATGYRTIAEIAPTKEEFPTAPPENLVAGSTVFTPASSPVPLSDYLQWWRYEKGANWRHPEVALRSRRAEREKARASWRLVSLHGSVLHALHGRHTRQGRGHHGQQPPRLSLREADDEKNLDASR